MTESKLEKECRIYVEGLGGRLPKWTAPGNRGVPDRILLLPDYEPYFVEFKWGRNLRSEPQKRWHRWLVESGFHVSTCKTFHEFLDIVELAREFPLL